MRKEYDFSNAVRGKFYVPPEEMQLPIYLDEKIRQFYYKRAKETGQSPTELINKVLSKDIEVAKLLQ